MTAAFSLGQPMDAGGRSAAPHSKLLSTRLARRRDARHPLPGRELLGRGSALLLPWGKRKNHPPANCCARRGAGVQPGGEKLEQDLPAKPCMCVGLNLKAVTIK